MSYPWHIETIAKRVNVATNYSAEIMDEWVETPSGRKVKYKIIIIRDFYGNVIYEKTNRLTRNYVILAWCKKNIPRF